MGADRHVWFTPAVTDSNGTPLTGHTTVVYQTDCIPILDPMDIPWDALYWGGAALAPESHMVYRDFSEGCTCFTGFTYAAGQWSEPSPAAQFCPQDGGCH